MATALELGREGWKHYVEAARKRVAPSQGVPYQKDEREKLLVRVRELADVLKARFGAQRVVLFGSLAHEAWFMPDSDVDLAVEGLADKDYWQAWRLAEEIISDRSVDLIDIETVGDSMKRAIERGGIEL